MRKTFLWIVGLAFFSSVGLSANAVSWEEFRQRWEDNKIYTVVKDPMKDVQSGEYLEFETKKCFRYEFRAGLLESVPITCSPTLLKNASTVRYRERDLKKFISKFRSCLEANDKICMKSLISYSAQTSFGQIPMVDSRLDLIETLTKQDRKLFLSLLQKISAKKEQNNEVFFGDVDGVGMRGSFARKDDHWQLIMWIGGD